MVRFVLIGGKGKDSNLNHIENEIIKMTNKKNPLVLYCPYATKDIEKSINKFHNLMKNLECEIIDLTFDNINDFDSLLNKADILYVGGGVSDDLVDIFKKYNLDKVLYKYLDSNKIYAGSSAGAMLYTKVAMGDKDMFLDNFHNYNYKMVDCLGILNISICPHYQNEDLIFYNDVIKEYSLDSFGIEEDTAVIIDDNKYGCLKDDKKRSVYYFSRDNYLMVPLYEGEYYEKGSSFRS
ncbi:MAG: Type 1 glutamine amidotransferase-like domain-containing protein [Acholeplasmatales bacterium]|nr:Type 1 glutamine amidotransferase-like domain-containing protein [Acholeplasmatales bacterium]